MSSWHTYPKIYNLGHAALRDLLSPEDEVIIEEKVDGSQFSFGVIDGVLKCKSRNRLITIEAPDSLFAAAVEWCVANQARMTPGWTYRGEVFKAPKHNCLKYDRIPRHHIMLFDINDGEESYLARDIKELAAKELDLEVVPLLYRGPGSGVSQSLIEELLDTRSILGDVQPEGIVIKNYHRFGRDGKAVFGKHVTEKFKEAHRTSWKNDNPNKGDIIQNIKEIYRTEARWHKAIQHLRDAGELTGEPKDIGPLMRELAADFHIECADEIKGMLWAAFRKDITRHISNGFPEFYKGLLLEKQFAGDEE